MIGQVEIRIDGQLFCKGTNLLMALGKASLASRSVGIEQATVFLALTLALSDSDEAVNEDQLAMPPTIYGLPNTWASTVVTPTNGANFLQWDFNLNDYQLGNMPEIKSFGLRLGAPLGGFLFARFLSTPFQLTAGMTLDVSWRLSLIEDLTDG